MTNAELIAKIKAEIKKLFNRSCIKRNLARKNHYSYSEMVHGAEMDVCRQLLYFISDIEKSLPKVDCEGLDEEINRTYHDGSVANTSDIDHVTYENIAEYFYNLGCHRTAEKYDELEYNRQRAEESEKPMNPNELEKEIEEYFPESTFNTGFNYDDLQEIARHFAQWGAEHLKK